MIDHRNDQPRRSPSLGWALLLLFSTVFHLAFVEESRSEERERQLSWQPTLALGFNVHSQGLEGTTETPRFVPADPPNPASGWFATGRGEKNRLQNIFFDAKVGLYAPPFSSEGLTPRLFIYAGAQMPFTDTFTAYRYNRAYAEGKTVGVCGGSDPGFNPPLADLSSCAITARNNVKLNGTWYAGLGVEFTLPYRQRRFHLRPSIAYMGQSYSATGDVETFEFERNVSIFREESVSGSHGSQVVHGFGPAFELGIDFAQVGPIGIEIYLETRFAWLIGNRDVSFSDDPQMRTCTTTVTARDGSKTTTPCATDQLSAEFSVGLDQFIAQGGAGLRFTWK